MADIFCEEGEWKTMLERRSLVERSERRVVSEVTFAADHFGAMTLKVCYSPYWKAYILSLGFRPEIIVETLPMDKESVIETAKKDWRTFALPSSNLADLEGLCTAVRAYKEE